MKAHVFWTVLVVVASGLLGCKPGLEEGLYACTSDATCPDGWFCRSDDRCYSTRGGGTDGGTDAGDATTDAADSCVPSTDQVDLLFVIDNSNSMTEEQASLATALPRLVLGAVGDTDLHMGVVTTDIGVGAVPVPTCSNEGDDGRLRTTTAAAGCMPTYPTFLTSTNAAEASTTVGDMACLSQQGTGGCGFEQPLEAALKAVTASTSALTFNGGDMMGQADRANAGFLRPDALLVVVFVTDEEDCSVRVPDLLNPGSVVYTGDLNLRCFEYPEAVQPVSRYLDGLLALRSPERLVVMSLAGVPPSVERESFEDILADADMEERIDPGMPGRLAPSCDVVGRGFAFPPRRMVELARDLDARGAGTLVRSICQADYAEPIQALATEISAHLAGTCP